MTVKHCIHIHIITKMTELRGKTWFLLYLLTGKDFTLIQNIFPLPFENIRDKLISNNIGRRKKPCLNMFLN